MSWVNLNDLYATKSELATKVPTSRTINGKALSSNVTLAASDIKLSNSTTLQSAWDSISQYKRIHYGTYVLGSGDTTTVISAKEVAAIFGISTSELEDKIAPIVYNGDFAANDCIVAGSISNDNGLEVKALSGSNPYRINTVLIRLFQYSISPTQLSFTKHVSINDGSISAARSGNVVVLSFFCAISGLPTNGNTVKLFSGLPEAFIATKGFIAAQYTNFVANFWIDTDGTVCITNKSDCNDAYWVVGSLVYIAAEQHSISRVRYTLKSGSSSSIIKLRKGYLSSDGFIDIAIFGKLGYLNFRGFNIAGDAHCYNAQFALNLELANDYSWVDIVLSNGKSSITDCGLVASGDNCYLNAWKTTSDDVRVSGFVVFELAQHSISPTTLWSGKVSSGTISLSESIYNYSVVGFWTCSGGSDDTKDRLVLCGVTPNMTFISGGSCGMSNSDIRDIRVGFNITSATTLTYVNVIRTMLYTNEWTVQGINYNRNVFGVVGIVKA